MLGNGVLEDNRYQEWMKKFGAETEVIIKKIFFLFFPSSTNYQLLINIRVYLQHVIVNEQYCPQRIMFHSTAISQFKLSKIDENQFRIPHYSNEPSKQLNLGKLKVLLYSYFGHPY